MTQHDHRPQFGPTEEGALLEALGAVRQDSALCGAAAGFNSQLYKKCETLRIAIDELAGELTGDPEYFWSKLAVSMSQNPS